MMFQLGFADALQAEREREVAELVRQRRLLQTDVDGRDEDGPDDERAKPRPQQVRAQATR